MPKWPERRPSYWEVAGWWGGIAGALTAVIAIAVHGGEIVVREIEFVGSAIALAVFIGITNEAQHRDELRWLVAVRLAAIGAFAGVLLAAFVLLPADLVKLVLQGTPISGNTKWYVFVFAAAFGANSHLDAKGFTLGTPLPALSAEQDRVLRREHLQAMAKGLPAGILIAAAAGWLAIVPAHGWQDWIMLVGFGALAGAVFCQHRVSVRHDRLTLSDAAMFGTVTGAALLLAISAARAFVASGGHQATANLDVALAGCWIVGAVQAWKRGAELKLYRRLRLVLGLLLAVIAGALVAYSFAVLALPTFTRSMTSADGTVLVGSLIVAGALIGLGLYSAVRFGAYRVPLRQLLSSVAAMLAGATTSRPVLFLSGSCWTILAALLWLAGSWWQSHPVDLSILTDVFGHAIDASGAAALIQGLGLLMSAAKATPQLEDPGARGAANIATEQ
jgi:hypothetical protein